MTFDLENDEMIALMQCAVAGAQAAGVLLGGAARPMQPIFEKIQRQYSDQLPVPPNARAAGNGASLQQ